MFQLAHGNRTVLVLLGMMLAISLIGFIDATYLTLQHYQQQPFTCSLTKGCDVVTSSVYSTIFNIPVALLGALYYLFLLGLVIFYFDTKKYAILTVLPWFTLLGFLFSIRFVYIQAIVLKAFCQYCLVSALTSTLLFFTAILLFLLMRRGKIQVD